MATYGSTAADEEAKAAAEAAYAASVAAEPADGSCSLAADAALERMRSPRRAS